MFVCNHIIYLCLILDKMPVLTPQIVTGLPGGRLSKFADIWRAKGACPSLVKTVQWGHTIQFESRPPLVPPSAQCETRLAKDQSIIVQKEIDDLVSKGALKIISRAEAKRVPGYYSKVFVVPKPDGKHRVIINMKPLNQYIKKETFRMESEKEVRTLLQINSWASVVDLSDAYYLVSIQKKHRKFCRFIFQGVIYEYQALPMGLTESPRIFTSISRFAGGLMRKAGVKVVLYMDDLLVVGTTKEQCEVSVRTVVTILQDLGFLLNVKKCSLAPNTTFTYLGCVWDTVNWSVGVKTEREDRLRKSAQLLLSRQEVKFRWVARFLGQVISCMKVIPMARARCRVTQWDFLAGQCQSKRDYENFFCLSGAARKELQFWAALQPGLSSPITLPAASGSLYTDACPEGFGIYFNGDLVSEKFDKDLRHKHINVQELAVLDRFLDIYPQVSDTILTWRVDNQAALAAIKNQGSARSWALCSMSLIILERAFKRNLVFEPVRISSEENVLADRASRNLVVEDWSISQVQVDKLFNLFGYPDVDLMATSQSRKCPAYMSWSREDRDAVRIDSLATDVDWTEYNMPYVFPPFPMLPQVLAKARTQRVSKMLLVAPWWPTMPFFPVLKEMLLDVRKFRFSTNLVVDMVAGKPPPDIPRLQLVGCLITGKVDQEEAASQRLRGVSLPHHGEPRQRGGMRDTGGSGSHGVKYTKFSQLRHL